MPDQINNRLTALQQWLTTYFSHCNISNNVTITLTPLTNDASFRRYFRLFQDNQSFVVMDAPPNKEDCQPFINIAQRLRQTGVSVPEVIAIDLEQGFLLLSDFGSQLYLPALTPNSAAHLYLDAINALVKFQQQADTQNLPLYNEALLQREMGLFRDWLLDMHLGISLNATEQDKLQRCFDYLMDNALAQPQVFVHRDYHSRNLMVLTTGNPGILDFQDAVWGPVSYDLVSLLRDCYIDWPLERVHAWLQQYLQLAQQAGVVSTEIDFATFTYWFDLMGIQRHLKASGIFARLYRRDGKPGYLSDIPRTLRYIVQVAPAYPALTFLQQLLVEQVLPALEKEVN